MPVVNSYALRPAEDIALRHPIAALVHGEWSLMTPYGLLGPIRLERPSLDARRAQYLSLDWLSDEEGYVGDWDEEVEPEGFAQHRDLLLAYLRDVGNSLRAAAPHLQLIWERTEAHWRASPAGGTCEVEWEAIPDGFEPADFGVKTLPAQHLDGWAESLRVSTVRHPLRLSMPASFEAHDSSGNLVGWMTKAGADGRPVVTTPLDVTEDAAEERGLRDVLTVLAEHEYAKQTLRRDVERFNLSAVFPA